ncbi:MAG: hypothetical protein ABI947_23620 [Chloroflexota bacterium]
MVRNFSHSIILLALLLLSPILVLGQTTPKGILQAAQIATPASTLEATPAATDAAVPNTTVNDAALIHKTSDGQWAVPLVDLGFSESIRLTGQTAQRELFLPVPQGMQPLELKAQTLTAPDVHSGTLEVRSGDLVLAAVVLQPNMSLSIPLQKAVVRNGVLALTFISRLQGPDITCTVLDGIWLDLQSPVFTLADSATQPTTVSNFLPPLLTQLILYVPPDLTAAEADAALRLTAAVTRRYTSQRPSVAVKTLQSGAALPNGTDLTPFERAIVIREGTTESLSLTANDPKVLVLGGSVAALGRESALLSASLSPLAADASVNVTQYAETPPALSQQITLDALGFKGVQISGTGRMEIPLAFSQADLGGPISAISVRLAGIYTPVDDATTTFSVLFNGSLVTALPLGRDAQFDTSVAIPANLLSRDNTLTVRFDYTPSGGDCRIGLHPMTAQIDGGSYLQVTRGQATPAGFGRFPQVGFPTLQVGFEKLSSDSLASAVSVTIALQRLTKLPLNLHLAAWSDALASKEAAFLVAENPASVASLNPPMLLDPLKVLDVANKELVSLDTSSDSAALQAFEAGGRDVLLLLHHGDPKVQQQLVSRLVEDPQGWYTLQGDVLFGSALSEPANLQLRGGLLHVEPLVPVVDPTWSRIQPYVQPALYFIAIILVLLFLAWAYPKVVRRSPKK